MTQRAHDYRHLVARWRAVARAAKLPLRPLLRVDGYPHFLFRTPALQETGGIYVSAGIHGDEPAATEGLIAWAEKHVRKLRDWPLFLLPCLNPWGLVGNVRMNARGLDLNRMFHVKREPVVEAMRAAVAQRQFSAAVMLHEDYDAQGVYLYEVQRVRPYWGEALLEAATAHLPIDPRLRIDGRKVVSGLHRRRVDRKRFAAIGYPEAIWLHLEHAQRAFTFETPSEFALERRVAAQVAVLEEMTRRVLG